MSMNMETLCCLCDRPVGDEGRYVAVEADEDGKVFYGWVCERCLSGETEEEIRAMHEMLQYPDDE
jgi:hypothetical protein